MTRIVGLCSFALGIFMSVGLSPHENAVATAFGGPEVVAKARLRCVNLTPYRINFVVDGNSTGWVRPDHYVPLELEVGPHTVYADDDTGKRRSYFINLPAEGYELKVRGDVDR